MPITEELNNIQTLESVGFDHKQAEALAIVIEKAQVNGQEDLKEFIRSENKDFRNEIRNEINNLHNELKQDIVSVRNELKQDIVSVRNELKQDINSVRNELQQDIKGLEVRMAYAQKDLLVKILGIVVATVGMAVTILKLFP